MKNWQKTISLYIVSQLITQFGTALVSYAITWYITLNTQSGLMMTLAIIFSFLPTFLLSPFAGVWSDRYSRKKLILYGDLGVAFTTLILAIVFLTGYKEIWLLFLISAIRALGSAIQMPASSALIPQIVPEEKLTKVNGYMQSALSLMNIISPIAAAALLGLASFEAILFIDVGTAIIGMAFLVSLKIPLHHNAKAAKIRSYFQDIKDGLAYLRCKGYLLRLFLFFAFFYFVVSPAAFLTPLQVVRSFGTELYRLTAVEIAFFLGMVAGGVLIANWGGFKNKIHTLIFSILISGVLCILQGTIRNFTIFLIVIFLIGISVAIFNTPTTVFLQERVSEDYYGRVFGILNSLMSSMFPLGILLFGPLGDLIPIETILVINGFILILEGFSMFRDRELLRVGQEGVKDGKSCK